MKMVMTMPKGAALCPGPAGQGQTGSGWQVEGWLTHHLHQPLLTQVHTDSVSSMSSAQAHPPLHLYSAHQVQLTSHPYLLPRVTQTHLLPFSVSLPEGLYMNPYIIHGHS